MKLRFVRLRLLVAHTLLWVFAAASLPCHADTVASLLGNFTINQYSGLSVSGTAVAVHYTVVYGQLPALSELHAADSDGNGVTSQGERDTYVGTLAPAFASGLVLEVDGASGCLYSLCVGPAACPPNREDFLCGWIWTTRRRLQLRKVRTPCDSPIRIFQAVWDGMKLR